LLPYDLWKHISRWSGAAKILLRPFWIFLIGPFRVLVLYF